jgi:hypothetical protein
MDNTYLEEFAKAVSLCLCIFVVTRMDIYKWYSLNMTIVAESDEDLSTGGSKGELHENGRCTCTTYCITRSTDVHKAKGSA